MHTKPIVTCILITYNHEGSIAKALDSMLAQETDFEYKILIEDDFSKDKTVEICSEYAIRYPDRIEFVPKQKNLGIVGNIYLAISKVHSEFYSMLEGDDYWCDDFKLQKQVDALRANPDCSFCGHNTLRIDHEGNERLLFTPKKHNLRGKYAFPKRYNKRDFVKVHPSSRLFRTSCLDLEHLKFKDSVVWDSSAYWYFLSKGNLFYINEVMSVYHYNGLGAFSGSSKLRRRYMSILNTLNINEELGFEHNHIFIPQILKHRRFLRISLRDGFRLLRDPARRIERYHVIKEYVEQELIPK